MFSISNALILIICIFYLQYLNHIECIQTNESIQIKANNEFFKRVNQTISVNTTCLRTILVEYRRAKAFAYLAYSKLKTSTNITIDAYLLNLLNITRIRQVVTMEHILQKPNMDLAVDHIDVDYGIILAYNLENIKKVFNKWHNSTDYHSRCKFIIIYLGEDSEIEELFIYTRKMYTYRVVIFDSTMNIYIPKQFSNTNCHLENIQKYNHCNSEVLLNIKTVLEEDYMNYRGCPVDILAMKYEPYVLNYKSIYNPGIEVEMLRIISKELNFKLNFIDNNYKTWGEITRNASFTLMFKDMYEQKAEFMIGMVIPTDVMVMFFDISKEFFPNEYRFYTPRAQRLPAWMNMAAVFDIYTWMILIGSYVIFSFVYHLFQVLQKFKRGYLPKTLKNDIMSSNKSLKLKSRNISRSFLDVFGMTLGKSLPQPRITLNRIFWLSWVFVSYIFSSSYENVLLSFLVTAIHEKQINSYKDIVESNYPICGNMISKISFEESYGDKYIETIYKRWNLTGAGDASVIMNKVAYDRNVVMMTNQRRIWYYMKEEHKFVINGEPQLHAMHPTVTFSEVIMMQKGHPLKAGLDKIIIRFLESGMFKKVDRESQYYFYEQIGAAPFVSLKVEHILGAINVYYIGMGVSLIVFLKEYFYTSK